MDVEKRSSKGGFLQLFDWNVKSRKKLFSNKSDLPENSKQGREIFNDSTISRLQRVHENGYGPSTRGYDDVSYASSVNGDEGYGTKAPGVVARLMGLDSLPTSNASVPCYTPFFDTHSFTDSHYLSGITDLRSEEHIVIYDSMQNKLDGLTKNPVEMMLHKVQSRPIERFQTEVLPSKSAKPISITHHKLLSPIKSPGFIPTMNTSYLMEAAAKIIEQSPRSTATHKLPSLGGSSVPLKIRGLKEKMEAAQRSARNLEALQKAKEQSSSKHVKTQPRDKVPGRGEVADSFRRSDTSKSSGPHFKNKERSVSLAVQAKVNVQKKDRFISVGSQNFVNQKEHSDTKYSSAAKNHSKSQKTVERRTSMNRPSDVLRPNSQKQNSGSNDERQSLKPLSSHQNDRKSVSMNGVSRPSNIVNRVEVNTAAVVRKSSVNIVGKEQLPSMMKKSVGKKQLVDGNSDKNTSMRRGERSTKCNFETVRSAKWDATERKNGMDIVSFTFTSPIKKSLSASSSPGHANVKKQSSFVISSSSESQSSFDPSVTGGDALGLLLEQKLKELTSKIESPHQDLIHSDFLSTCADSFSDSTSTLNVAHTKFSEKSESIVPKDIPNAQYKSDCSSTDGTQLKALQMLQGVEDMEAHSSMGLVEYDREIHRTPRPVASLEPAYSEGSCHSVDSTASISSEASKKFLSFEAYEMTQWSSTKKFQPEVDMELSDSASSISLGGTSVMDISLPFTSMIANESPNWEFEYIRSILGSADLMLEEFALGEAPKIISPNLFDRLRDEKLRPNRNAEENFKVVQKVLFDYVEESLELRCTQLFSGSWKCWGKSTILLQRKDRLAEELCREISGWTSMEDFMVDELVDKDMSSHMGRWVDFETESFGEGVVVEKEILSDLLDELVDDFFT